MSTPTRTKVIATVGPATAGRRQVDALLHAGVDVFRINCAHGTHEGLRRFAETIRACTERRRLPVSILADLGGPKLRIGRFKDGGADLQSGDSFVLTTEDVIGSRDRVHVDYDLPPDVARGQRIFLNDGLVTLVITAVKRTEVHTRVEVGGRLTDRKGLSVPAAAFRTPSLTKKDRADLRLLARLGVDYVGLSFVRSAADVRLLRATMKRLRMEASIVAKIEKEQAISNLDDIVGAADAIMVARGDLGVECPIHDVAVLQKRIIQGCKAAGVPVITATQMLESMVASPRPTRAEATDVANAVLDGTDAVMLSGETATGRYPVEAVAVMRRIVASSESYAAGLTATPLETRQAGGSGAAIGLSAAMAADSVDAQAIVCLTQSGASAREIARWRPRRRLLAVTPRASTWRRLSLLWGTEPVLVDDFEDDFDRAAATILRGLRQSGRLDTGRPVVVTAGLPFSAHGRTNTLRIEEIVPGAARNRPLHLRVR
jgi:pyruvate kinase